MPPGCRTSRSRGGRPCWPPGRPACGLASARTCSARTSAIVARSCCTGPRSRPRCARWNRRPGSTPTSSVSATTSARSRPGRSRISPASPVIRSASPGSSPTGTGWPWSCKAAGWSSSPRLARRITMPAVPPPLSVTLPRTDYFELDSQHVGDRLAIWVTRPVDYDRGDVSRFPAIYVTDGNVAAAMLAPYAEHTAFNLISAFQPYLQVTVGYPPEKAADWLTLRNRDLVPADEPAPPSMIAAVAADAETAGWTQQEHDEYLRSIREGRAAQFLAFLEDELRPVIDERYRVRPEGSGLFGYSYGGLFTMYALMRRSPMFQRYGAGSPGVLSPDSQVFRLEAGIADRGEDFDHVQLHLTVHELEKPGRSHIYRAPGIHSARLIDRLYLSDYAGLDF